VAEYRLTDSKAVVRTLDNAVIPDDPNNFDYVAYTRWRKAGGVPDLYEPPPEPVPTVISDWQFYMQLSIMGIISPAEAKAANSAVIPEPLMELVAALPEEQKFPAEMLLGGATTFRRDHPLTEAIRRAYGWSSTQVDDFFRAAAALG
jgi:hypothetical protein